MSAPIILLVDDNAAHRTLVKRAITKAGIRLDVVEAGSLQEARERLFAPHENRLTPAVTILDLNLGDGRSTALIEELRASNEHRDLPVLVLSTSGLESDMRESYALGANCYLTKADDMTSLAREIGAGVSFLLEVTGPK